MITQIQPTKTNERSQNAATVYASLRVLGLTLDPDEVKDQITGLDMLRKLGFRTSTNGRP